MRTTLLLATFLLTSFFGISQNLTNGSLSGNCIGNGFSAPSCIKGWAASHGTPVVSGNLNTNTWATLRVTKENGGGIYTNYAFEVGKKYEISFKVKAVTNLNAEEIKAQNPSVNVRTASNLSNTTSDKLPKIEETSELAWAFEVNKAKSFWQIVRFTFIPIQNNAQLWFYPSVDNATKLGMSSMVQMEIDDITVQELRDNHLVHFQSTSQTYSDDFVESVVVVSNPIFRGRVSKIFTNDSNLKEISLIDLSGNIKNINFTIANKETINFVLDEATAPTIYTLKMTHQNGKIITKKIIVQ
ncbi:T9SS type A sorting domain-containing protein [Flavobacterium sp. NRK F7]|uniref:T9SS type A sorting domain-containing protein n=1 Tax=Flavobacterium sp. NRK F7 TaxID=2954930 RepID=UPI002090B33D|nr:T9SS type A sorting domain-containing protein [Flavobacterium sp. NRK F7]MCO6162408.1 T9SS type A sorting domain-containing protein [Flavobacterium sp. NRK F7]